MRGLHYSLIICLLSVSAFCYGQKTNGPLITAEFVNSNIDEFVKTIEEKSNYRFYYNRTDFDSFYVTMQVRSMPLEDVLKTAFRSTDFIGSIDEENNVFLTKGTGIFTHLATPVDAYKRDSLKYTGTPERSDNRNTNNSFANEKLHQIGIKKPGSRDPSADVLVYIVSDKTKAPLTEISILLDGNAISLNPVNNGGYKIRTPKGNHTLTITSFGKKPAIRRLMVNSDGALHVEMEDEVKVLDDVFVTTQKYSSVNRTALGVEKINIKSIKRVPTAFGEADLLRVITTLPGVKTVGEASTGFNVRGGGADQNLILFNDATIYNPSHFFGFFSAFNPEIIKDVELFKSSIPAKFGGRLSSVLNITGREGNKEKIKGTAGVGLITSRINVEGPIVKDKSSFNVGARTTYANWLLKLLPDPYKNSAASFYDVNLILSQKINNNNDLSFTGYVSSDKFRLGNDTTYGYENKSASIKWKHKFSAKTEADFIFGYDGYSYFNSSESNKVNAYNMTFDIGQLNVKADFNYALNAKHSINYGLSSILYKLHPGSLTPTGTESLIASNITPPEQALESAVYIGDQFDVSNKFSVSGGFRFSRFDNLGPSKVNIYKPNMPKDDASLIETATYGSGKIVKTYQGPEIRMTAKYTIGKNASLKAGYNTLRQYIHMLSNTTAISPTDIWKLSDYNIQPQLGDQLSLGIFKNFGKDSLESSIEVYYKRLENILDYKSGAQLILNPHLETDVINTKGKAYGVELMLKKKTGKVTGWVSYTYSRTLLKMDDENVGVLVNQGQYYPANYDKPHDATLVGNYAPSHRYSFSFNVTYSTGRPITLPIGRYNYGGSERALYSDRNAFRIPDYFRADLSINIEGNHKVHQLTHNSWTIGVYNLTGRKNPYSVYYTSENGVVNGYKLSIFGSAIPFINYNIRF